MSNKGRRRGNKKVVLNTFLGRGKNNEGASYRWEYIDDGKNKKIVITNIGTNKEFIVPRYPEIRNGGHLSYKDNLKAIKELTDYDATTDRGLEWKLKGLFLPDIYDGNGITLGEFDLNNA